jgi:hypothetical protein
MQESQRSKIEAKLKRMIELQKQSQTESQRVNVPPGTRAIRRRKGAPDKHIM